MPNELKVCLALLEAILDVHMQLENVSFEDAQLKTHMCIAQAWVTLLRQYTPLRNISPNTNQEVVVNRWYSCAKIKISKWITSYFDSPHDKVNLEGRNYERVKDALETRLEVHISTCIYNQPN